jgi:hypothetical protein
MATSCCQGYKDIFYHCIPILNTQTPKELGSKLSQYAAELYEEQSVKLRSILGESLSKDNWIRRAQRMVINSDYDSDENTFYISLFKKGICSSNHDKVVTLLAAKLMSKAPMNHPIQRTVISSDRTFSADSIPWLTYKDGELVAANPLTP